METDAQRKFDWSTEASSPSQWRNMERSGRAGEDVDAVPLARLSRFNGGDVAYGYRSVDGHNRLLLKRLRARRIPQQLVVGENQERAARSAPQPTLLHGPHSYGRRR